MSDTSWILAGLLTMGGWFGFCALVSLRTARPSRPVVTDPGREVIAALTTVPRPPADRRPVPGHGPHARHRAAPLPFTRPTTTGSTR